MQHPQLFDRYSSFITRIRLETRTQPINEANSFFKSLLRLNCINCVMPYKDLIPNECFYVERSSISGVPISSKLFAFIDNANNNCREILTFFLLTTQFILDQDLGPCNKFHQNSSKIIKFLLIDRPAIVFHHDNSKLCMFLIASLKLIEKY